MANEHSAPRRHRLSDWLSLHGISAVTCLNNLQSIQEPPCSPGTPGLPFPDTDLQAARALVHDALLRLFPSHSSTISETLARTQLILVDRDRCRGVTVDNGADVFPTILCSYDGTPLDLLVLAHEYGHALQIRLSQGRSVSPICREVCAFLAERVLLVETSVKDTVRHRHLRCAAQTDDLRYFGANRLELERALAGGDPIYRYTWNYPMARHIAGEIDRLNLAELRLALFGGYATTADLVALGERALPA